MTVDEPSIDHRLSLVDRFSFAGWRLPASNWQITPISWRLTATNWSCWQQPSNQVIPSEPALQWSQA